MSKYPEFAALLNTYLRERNLTPSHLATRLGMTPSTGVRWANGEYRPDSPELVVRAADVLGIHDPGARRSLLAAAGYAYQEAPAGAQVQPERAAVDLNELAVYLQIMRTQHRFLETRGYRSLTELSGPPIRLPVLQEGESTGVYTPLRYDLQMARETMLAGFEGDLPDQRAGRAGQIERSLSQTDVGLDQVLGAPGHLALIGKAGCGKTTVLRLIAMVLAEQDADQARQWLGWKGGALPAPVFLALRDFEHAYQTKTGKYGRNVESLLRFLDDQFNEWHPDRLSPGFLGRLVQSGQAWLLIDALDEVPDFDHRIDVRRAIEGLASEIPGIRMLVTARVAAYSAHAQARLDDRFNVAMVHDLTAKEWAPLIERLYTGLEAGADVAGRRAALLLQRIERSDLLQEMVKTPLMVWTATLIDSTGRELPEQRAELYNAYTEVLLGERLKEEESAEAAKMLREDRWPKNDRRLYLTYAAFQTHEASAGQQADKQRRRALVVVDEYDLTETILAPYLTEYLGLSKPKARDEARDFVKVMAERSGILHAQPGGYSFGDHLTVQEFLAASYLVDNLRTEIDRFPAFVAKCAGQSWWQEVFLLAAGYLLRNPLQAKRFLEHDLGAIAGGGDAHVYGLAWAGQALLEIPAERVGWHADVRDELARRLVQVLWRNPPSASTAARVEAGHVLGRLGDPRFSGPYSLPEFISIPGGTFWMGSDQAEVERLVKETGETYFRDELPRHQVELSPFAIALYPTTNAMYRHFVEEAGGYGDERWWSEAKAANAWRRDGTVKDWAGDVRRKPRYWDDARFNGPNQPVVGVTWYEAVAYCRWLTAALADGLEYRLPTEAEWERAARGPHGWRYPWGDEWIEGRANTEELKLERTTAAGVFPDGASGEGVLDLSGNAWEWCSDWYSERAYAGRVERNPQGPAKWASKILRGGSWYNDRTFVRCAYRYRNDPDAGLDRNGFRVARGSLI